MDNIKARENFNKKLWNITDDLRCSIYGGDFKHYVLGMLLYRAISENISNYINKNEHEAGNKDFSYALLNDTQAEHCREFVVEEKGFFINPSELFDNVRKASSVDTCLNETLQKIFKNIEGSAKGKASEKHMSGLFDDIDVNSEKLGSTSDVRNAVLTKLMNSIAELNTDDYGDSSIDLFGDAYEYLMNTYAMAAGRSGGEFFTPSEVSELLARITVVGKTEVKNVYDPTCGSGSLLLKFAKILGKENVRNGFYGQEINITTYNLCRVNMFLHDINYDHFDIVQGNTLIEPKHWDEEPFEAIVSNPPYSIKWEGDASTALSKDERFTPAGVLAPKSKADLAFVMHTLSWLANNGTAAIVCFPGVMYRGGAEQKIRQYLIDENFIDAVIQLPQDLFFGTTIATCILVLKKNKADNKTLFIDATVEFVRGSGKNKLTNSNAKRILDCYAGRETQEHFARLVDHAEIAQNNYNISAGSYVKQKDTSEIVDIKQLNADIKELVKRQDELRMQIDAIVDDLE